MPSTRAAAATDDLSTLAWVHEELRKSLETAHKALRRYLRDVEAAAGSDLDDVDPAVLRTARQQLHQSMGALELVNIAEGATLLRASEALVKRYVAKPQRLDSAGVAAIERASFALLDYLGRRLAGKPVQAVGLFPALRALLELNGAERIHPADLWPCDWRWCDIPALAVRPRAVDAVMLSSVERRLLALVRSNAPDQAVALRADCCAIAASLAGADMASAHDAATLWRLAAGFFEAWALGLLPQDVFVKRTGSRLLGQLRSQVKGDTAVSDRLAQDLLFYCARAAVPPGAASPCLSAVRAGYAQAVPAPPAAALDYNELLYGRFDPAAVALARKRVEHAKQAFATLAGGELHRLEALAEPFSLVQESLARLYPGDCQLGDALLAMARRTVAQGRVPDAAVAMEVATSLLSLDAFLEDADFDQPEGLERLRHLAGRLDAVGAGAPAQPLDPWMEALYRRVSDRHTLGSVVHELRGRLQEVERQLDRYFRHPEQVDALGPVPGALSDMRGVFTVLGVEPAVHTVGRMRDDVLALVHPDGGPDIDSPDAVARMHRVAGNLGALGFLVDMLHVQPQLAKALFIFDPRTGLLAPLMGRHAAVPDLVDRAQAIADAAQHDDMPLADVTAELNALASQPLILQQPGLADSLNAARAAIAEAVAHEDASGDGTARGHVVQAMTDFVSAATAPMPLDPLEPSFSRPVPLDGVPVSEADLAADPELRDVFLEEAHDVLGDARNALSAVAVAPSDTGQITALRRAFHTLKGSARMVGLGRFAEAAWACEQLYNHWLAEAAPASPALQQVSAEALRYFAAWTEAIAAGQAAGFVPEPVMAAAEALRLAGEVMPIALPDEAPAGPPPAWTDAAAVPLADETLALDLEIPDAAHSPVLQPLAASSPVPLDEAALAATPPGAADLPAVDLATVDLPLDLSVDLPVAGTPADPAPTPSTPDPVPLDISHFLPADLSLDLDASSLAELAPEPAVRWVGPLRVPAELFSIYTTEADDLSRRLVDELDEWALLLADAGAGAGAAAHAAETDVPASGSGPAETTVALAHALGGSSATVGYEDLCALARDLEAALERARHRGHCVAADVALFQDAAHEIRRLLQQFAAGFLREPDNDLGARVRQWPQPDAAAPAAVVAEVPAAPSARVADGPASALDAPPVAAPAADVVDRLVADPPVADAPAADATAADPVSDRVALPAGDAALAALADAAGPVVALPVDALPADVRLADARLAQAQSDDAPPVDGPPMVTPVAPPVLPDTTVRKTLWGAALAGAAALVGLGRRAEPAPAQPATSLPPAAPQPPVAPPLVASLPDASHEALPGVPDSAPTIEKAGLDGLGAERPVADAAPPALGQDDVSQDPPPLQDVLRDDVPQDDVPQDDVSQHVLAPDAAEHQGVPQNEAAQPVGALADREAAGAVAHDAGLQEDGLLGGAPLSSLPEPGPGPADAVPSLPADEPAASAPDSAVPAALTTGPAPVLTVALPVLDAVVAHDDEELLQGLAADGVEITTLESIVPTPVPTSMPTPTPVPARPDPAPASPLSAARPEPIRPEPVRPEPVVLRDVVVLEALQTDIDQHDQIDAELFPIFAEEAEDLLPQLAHEVQAWQAHPQDQDAGSACMRQLHTFKGGARLAGAMRLGEMAHRCESAIQVLMNRERVDPEDLTALQARIDTLTHTFERLRRHHAGESLSGFAPLASDAGEWSTRAGPLSEFAADAGEAAPDDLAGADSQVPVPLEPALPIDWARLAATGAPGALASAAASGAAGAAGGAAADRPASVAQPVRVRIQTLDRLVNLAGEVNITRARLDSEVGQIRSSLADLADNLDRLDQQLHDIALQADTQLQSRREAARVAAQEFDPLELDRYTRLQELTRILAESVNDVATVRSTLHRTVQTAEDELAVQARLTRELQSDLLRTRMVEFESLSERLYRVVRQAAKETGKLVRLDLVGGSIEVDRSVLDRMVPAFEHLLRNCVSHGIELPAQRQAAGKEPTGSVVVTVEQEGNEVTVEVRDDGAGLDLAAIRQRAEGMGLVDPGAAMTDKDLAALILAPGLSTAAAVTELSGRGVGMDVVRADVQAMGGRVEIHSDAGRGTRFKAVLPLTTVVTQVVMLRSGDTVIAVPSNLIELVQRATPASVEAAYRDTVYLYGGLRLPFFWLGALLDQGRLGPLTGRTLPVVVLRSAQHRIALHVDDVLGTHEVVVKSLGPQLSGLPGLAGLTLLPTGQVALIYNPVTLAALYGEQARQQAQLAVAASGDADPVQRQAVPPQAPLVLVVDDSLTVRRVTKRLLEREGYRTTLAKDGLEALDLLNDERPALVLSDIEMPRMDGFDLLRNVRSDALLCDLPVLMITSRIAEKHRDHAMQLGANHYLGKPYSEDELLSLIRRYAPRPRHGMKP